MELIPGLPGLVYITIEYFLDYEVIASSGQPSIDIEDGEKVPSPRQTPKKTMSRREIQFINDN